MNPPSPFLLDDRVFAPLGLLQVAAVLEEAGHDVYVADLGGVADYTGQMHKEIGPGWDVYGITATTPQFPMAVELLGAIRGGDPGKRVVLGGPHATVMPESCGMFDCVVRGDGEEAVLEALSPTAPQVLDRATTTVKGELRWHLPARHLLDMETYRYSLEGSKGTSVMASMGCPFNCVSGATFASLESGLLRLNEIAVRDSVVCVEGHKHSFGEMGVAQVVSNGKKRCMNVELKNGLCLSATPDHLVLCAAEEHLVWKRVSDLKIGDYVGIGFGENKVENCVTLPPPSLPKRHLGYQWEARSVSIPAVLNEDVAWIVGFLLGDGCLPKDGRPATFFVVDKKTRGELLPRLERCFGYTGALSEHTQSDKVKNVWVHSRLIRNFFEQSLGIDPMDKLHVPEPIRRSPPKVVLAFLDGLWAADGYQRTEKFRFHSYLATVSKDFAQEVASLLLWVGLGASVVRGCKRSRGPGKGFYEDQWNWRVSRCWPECWTDKRGRPCWTSSIPLASRRIYRSRKSGKLHWRTTTGKRRGAATRVLLSELCSNHELLREKLVYVPIRSISDAGVLDVYDVAVHPTHRFSANGVVVHNCSFCCGRALAYYRRFRARSPREVAAELEHLSDRYGIRAVTFFDDEVNILQEPLVEWCQLVKPYGMKFRGFIKANLFNDVQAAAMAEAGFVECCTGVESGSDRILGVINKQTTRVINKRFVDLCHKHGMRAKAFMSLAQAGEDYVSAMATKDWLLWARPDDFDVTIVCVYPATPYWDERTWVGINAGGHRVCRYVKQSRRVEEDGATLFFEEVDYSRQTAWYKGVPGAYVSHTWTPDLSKEDLVRLRDEIEEEVRTKLGIPYPKRYSGDFLDMQGNVDHSMGMGVSPQDSRVVLKGECQ